MKKFICTVCQWVYDPEVGDPESGIEPGTAFEDIPEDWVCPVCGVGKDDAWVKEITCVKICEASSGSGYSNTTCPVIVLPVVLDLKTIVPVFPLETAGRKFASSICG